MGYSMDLEDYDERELNHELERRRKMREQGLCDYCARKPDTSSCRFPDRHRAKSNT
jgi:hypothetical protein